jgi:trans-aconitate 2-methyltransferase
MPTWDSQQYLRFQQERTQPSVDLTARIVIDTPARFVDLGCGPGNSTAVVAQRWPGAAATGVDTSAAMLATARKDAPQRTWIQQDITAWADSTAAASWPLVFSNAAFQWVPSHGTLLPKLFAAVAPGGALAFQIPHTLEMPHHTLIHEVADSPAWQSRFLRPPVSWHAEPVGFYYDALAPLAARVEAWATEYFHVLDGPQGIVEWYRGTGLRPYLDLLPDEEAKHGYLRDYLAALTPLYPRQKDGRVLMPFRRLFVIAYR